MNRNASDGPTSPASTPAAQIDLPAGVTMQTTTYRTVAGESLRMLIFRPEAAGDAAMPAIVWFHGGGWKSGAPEKFVPFCVAAARSGMVAVAPQYRLVGQQASTAWDCMDDAWAAYRWLVEHAASLGADPQRIVIAGSSAGGHLAATLVTHHDDAHPAAMVLLNPVLDCTEQGYPMPDRGREASPVFRVRSGLPPTLVVHGDADTVVPYENSVRFTQLMREAGNACTLVTEAGEDHGLWSRHTQRMIDTTSEFMASLGLVTSSRHISDAPG